VIPERFDVVGEWIDAGEGEWGDDAYWLTFARRIRNYPPGIPEPWGLLGQRPNLDVFLLDLAQPFDPGAYQIDDDVPGLARKLREQNIRAVKYIVPG